LEVPVEFLHVSDAAVAKTRSGPSEIDAYLKKIAESFAGVAVDFTVEAGSPASVIVDLANTQPGTLIAMATHGYSGLQRWLLGSVTEKVLHAAKNHLLLVRPGEDGVQTESELKTILVPLDGSRLAEKALPAVSELAARLKLEVVLVRVLSRIYFAAPEAYLPVFGMNIPNPKELWAEGASQAKTYLTGKAEELRAAGTSPVSFLLIEGGGEGAAAEIVDLAGKTPHCLVAIGSHGQTGLGRWLLGSVAERAVRHSRSPVLVIRSES
jgi:nucleotide-binding universal stress UspA family protein